MNFFTFTIVGSAVVMIGSFLRREQDKYSDVCVAALLPILVILKLPLEQLTVYWHRTTVDAALYRMDLAIGLDPLTLCKFVFAHRLIYLFLFLIYVALPLMMAVRYAVSPSRAFVAGCIITPAIAFIGYNLVPATGPIHAFAGFPFAVTSIRLSPEGVRNCFPSMHFTWAVLTAFGIRVMWLRAVAWMFVFFTAAATIGLGEHYYVDLIAAVPFSILVSHVCQRFEANGTQSGK